MDRIEQWTALVRAPGLVPLDRAAMVLAACFDAEVDVARQLARLDELAADVPEPTLDGLLHHLFVTEGFRGDREDFHSPQNSLLPAVLDRHLGLPISLAVLAMETGRRLGIGLVGVGLPGHFLLREQVDAECFIDVYQAGRRLERVDCVDIFSRLDPASRFHDRYLDDTSTEEILGRMTANLLGSFALRHQRAHFALTLRLRGVLPHVQVTDRLQTAEGLVTSGRVDWAADVLEAIAADHPGDAEALTARARTLRARLN